MWRKISQVLLFLALTGGLSGQTSGRIVAKVYSAGNQPAAGVELELVLSGTDAVVAGARTDPDGAVLFTNLQVGVYDIRTRPNGTLVRARIFVSGIQTSNLGTLTDPAGLQDAEPTTTTEVATVFPHDQMDRLPVLGRDPTRLAATVPGGGTNARSPTFFNGLRPGYTVVTLDGVNILDQFDRSGLDSVAGSPQIDAIAEMAVIPSNPSVRYGFGSSQVILSTPSARRGDEATTITRNAKRIEGSPAQIMASSSLRPPGRARCV